MTVDLIVVTVRIVHIPTGITVAVSLVPHAARGKVLMIPYSANKSGRNTKTRRSLLLA